MGFFNKPNNAKKENIREDENNLNSLPELPNLPELPGMDFSRIDDIPQRVNKMSPLPNFPQSSLGEKVNRDTVKDAIRKGRQRNSSMENSDYNTPSLPPIMGYPISGNSINPETINMIKRRTMEIDGQMPMMEQSPIIYNQNPQSAQPLFIKLDTFEKSISTFNEVKLRVGEIETLLRNIKETKMKEENELAEWE